MKSSQGSYEAGLGDDDNVGEARWVDANDVADTSLHSIRSTLNPGIRNEAIRGQLTVEKGMFPEDVARRSG